MDTHLIINKNADELYNEDVAPKYFHTIPLDTSYLSELTEYAPWDIQYTQPKRHKSVNLRW